MARAAAKRRQGARTDARHRHKDSGGQSLEQTLFFNRLRRQAKWVFVFLAVVFAGGFVIFGVGSDIGGGLGDVIGGLRGGDGSGSPSIEKALDATKEHPKSAKAWGDLAEAYELGSRPDAAIKAWTTYTVLRPKNVDGASRLAALYEGKANRQTEQARIAAYEVQAAQSSTFAPPTTTPLGRAFAEHPDPIAQTVAATANARYNDAILARAGTLQKLVGMYGKLAKLQPREPAAQLQLATAAQNAGDPETAVGAYKAFIRLAPDDPNAAYAKQQIKTLQSEILNQPQG